MPEARTAARTRARLTGIICFIGVSPFRAPGTGCDAEPSSKGAGYLRRTPRTGRGPRTRFRSHGRDCDHVAMARHYFRERRAPRGASPRPSRVSPSPCQAKRAMFKFELRCGYPTDSTMVGPGERVAPVQEWLR